jgi:hypothetical protein
MGHSTPWAEKEGRYWKGTILAILNMDTVFLGPKGIKEVCLEKRSKRWKIVWAVGCSVESVGESKRKWMGETER